MQKQHKDNTTISNRRTSESWKNLVKRSPAIDTTRSENFVKVMPEHHHALQSTCREPVT